MARPGPPPKPTAVKRAAGNPGKRRLNRDEPRPRKLRALTPPAHLTATARDEWRSVAPELAKLELLTVVDRAALAAYCALYARWVEAERYLAAKGLTYTTSNGTLVPFPQVAIARHSAHELRLYAAEFGFTPSARSRLHVKPPEQESEDDRRLGRA